jgi:hypothetical protein
MIDDRSIYFYSWLLMLFSSLKLFFILFQIILNFLFSHLHVQEYYNCDNGCDDKKHHKYGPAWDAMVLVVIIIWLA